MLHLKRRTIISLGMLLVLIVPILAACGGTTTPTAQPTQPGQAQTTQAPAQPTEAPAQPTEAPAPTEAPSAQFADTVIIGMSQEPDTMYSLISSMAVQRTVDNAIKEPWITQLDYTFEANPRYLQGELPTVDNGGAVLEEVEAFIDETGAITTTDTGVTTQTTQLVVTFQMQPGLKWEDGEPLTTADVVFGHEVGCDPNSGATSFITCNKIEKVEAVDETTWKVYYKPGVTDSLYFAIINGSGVVLPKHELEGTSPADLQSDPRLTEHPMGWGPYKLEEGGWKKGQSITVTKNEHYVGAPDLPKIPQVIFQIIPDTNQLWASLYAGEIDLATSDGIQADLAPTIENAEKAGKVRAYFLSSAVWEHMDFNFNRTDDLTQPSLLADLVIRQAIAYGANRQGYVDAVYSGKSNVMHSWIPNTSWAYAGDENLTIYTYDVTKANQLLDEAGYVDTDGDGIREKDGEPLSFTFRTTAGNRMRERLSQLFQADMKAIGIDIQIDLLPASVWFGDESGLSRRDFQIGEFAWVGQADPGGETLYACNQIPVPENNWEGQNFMGWCNEVASEAIIKANASLSVEERKEAYKIHQIEFTKDLPSLPLFNRLEIFVSAPDLQNVQPNPTEYVTWNIADWEAPPRDN
ncbi:MAG: ABC transporter substrate-binding protein [Herpetosiphonaceae bacterium]|nr:MAG: ABC transporter substrate-binding protein [Herpetosiphonaceae bacterium]